jgi:hypothetical protein
LTLILFCIVLLRFPDFDLYYLRACPLPASPPCRSGNGFLQGNSPLDLAQQRPDPKTYWTHMDAVRQNKRDCEALLRSAEE